MYVLQLYLLQETAHKSESLSYKLGFFVGNNLYAILAGFLILGALLVFIITKVIRQNKSALKD